MRADKNWEESVGKKLFEFEGELSPQAWNNISKKIRPKRRNRWFIWVPLVLLFCSLPLAVYYENKSGLIHSGSESTPAQISQNSQNSTGNTIENKTVLKSQPGSEETAINQPSKTAENKISQTELKTKPGQSTTENLPGTAAYSLTGKTLPAKTKTLKVLPTPIVDKQKTLAVITGENSKKENKENAIEKRPKSKTASKDITSSKILIAAASKQKPSQYNLSQKQKASGKIGSENPKTNINNSTEKSVAKSSNETPKTVAISKIESEKITGFENTSLAGTKTTNQTATKKETLPNQSKNATDVLAKTDSVKLANTDNKLTETNTATDSSATENKEKQKKNWSFSIYGTPQYTVQQVSPNKQDEILILKLNNKNDFSSERIGYEVGLRSFYPLNEKFKLEFGLHFARLNQHLSLTTASTFADSAVTVSQNGPIVQDVFNRQLTEEFNLKYFYGGLFLGSNVALGQNFQVSAGLGLNGLVKAKPKDTARELGSKALNPYVSAGLKYNYPLSSGLILQAGPTMQYYLKPIQKKTAYFSAQPTTFGFSIGILFQTKP